MTVGMAVAKFLTRFAISGAPPRGSHDSAKSKEAVVSQPANELYLDCKQDVEAMEAILSLCVKKGLIVEPFGLALGLGINQPTFEATQKGLDAGKQLLEALA